MNSKHQIEQLILEGNLSGAISQLLKATNENGQKDLYNMTILQSARYNQNENGNILGILSHQDYQQTRNQITYALQSVLDKCNFDGVPNERSLQTTVTEKETAKSTSRLPKIFISYSFKDHQVAFKIKQKLTDAGLEVIIDVDAMNTGESNAGFIKKCIQQSGITLSLVSPNSLMSAWVAMETIWSTYDETLRGRYFMPCTIDNSFFNYSFTDEALDALDVQTTEIKNTIKVRLQKGRGIEDLTEELTRINRLKNELPTIVGKLKNSFCVNISDDNFETGMGKVISDIRKMLQN